MDSGEGDTGASRLALVTGASRGIGEAFAQLLAEQGYRLVIVARSEGELNRVSGVLGSKYETTVVPIRFDLCEPHAGEALASELEGRGLRPDVIVNNAGFGLLGPAAELPLEDQLEMIDVNVKGAIHSVRAALPHLMRSAAADVVTIASEAGRRGGVDGEVERQQHRHRQRDGGAGLPRLRRGTLLAPGRGGTAVARIGHPPVTRPISGCRPSAGRTGP